MQIVKLNLIPGGVLPVCFASQHDTGRVIRFMLFEGENVFTLSGAETIALRLQKPDGSELVESVTNTGADYVDVVTTADTCDTAGASVGEIVITDGGDILGSANFGLFVESDAFEGGGIVTQTATGAIATFETNIETAFVSLKSDINPVQSGTGTPSPQNVRPISGFSALNVTRTGVNLVKKQALMQPVHLASGTTIYAKLFNFSGQFNLYGLKKGLPDIVSNWTSLLTIGSNLRSVTLTDDYESIGISSGAYSDLGSGDIQVSLAPFSDFSTYNGQTATVNFGQTVYGGSLDVTNGKVKIDFANDRLDAKTWSYNSSRGAFNATFSDKDQTRFDEMICSCYENGGFVYSASEIASKPDKAFYTQNNSDTIFIKDSDYTDPTTWLNALGSNTICYPLTTPIEITTTPENLTAIVGQNNVYGDTNGDTEVEYYIEV